MTQNKDNLIWIDLEMTGLDPKAERIIEIACIITDKNLNIIAESEELAIHQSDDILDNMDDWCKQHHGSSGLTARVKASNLSEKAAEKNILDFIKKYVPAKTSPLCGNTIYQDRRFLAEYMPELEDYCHYRLLDVSSVKILAQYWAPKVFAGVKKKAVHRAKDDIRESINELKYYYQHFIKIP